MSPNERIVCIDELNKWRRDSLLRDIMRSMGIADQDSRGTYWHGLEQAYAIFHDVSPDDYWMELEEAD